MKRRVLALRRDLRIAVQLAGGGLVHASARDGLEHRFEQPCDAQPGDVAGHHRQVERRGDEALRGEVVDLVGAHALEHAADARLVGQIQRRELHLGGDAERVEALERRGSTRAARHRRPDTRARAAARPGMRRPGR